MVSSASPSCVTIGDEVVLAPNGNGYRCKGTVKFIGKRKTTESTIQFGIVLREEDIELGENYGMYGSLCYFNTGNVRSGVFRTRDQIEKVSKPLSHAPRITVGDKLLVNCSLFDSSNVNQNSKSSKNDSNTAYTECIVKYIGRPAFDKGIFYGIQLLNEYQNRGDNNGTVDNIWYFDDDSSDVQKIKKERHRSLSGSRFTSQKSLKNLEESYEKQKFGYFVSFSKVEMLQKPKESGN